MKSKQKENKGVSKKNNNKILSNNGESFNENFLFPVVYLLHQNNISNFYSFFLFLSLETLQLMIYPFQTKFKGIWKEDKMFDIISKNIQFLSVLPFFEDSKELYLLVFFALIVIHSLLFLSLILVMHLHKKKKIKALWPFMILSLPFSEMSHVLFLPVIEIIISIFHCNKNRLAYAYNVGCNSNEHKLYMAIGGIFYIVYSIFYCFATYILCDIRRNNLVFSAKKTSIPDLFLLIFKVYLSITNALFNRKEYNLSTLFLTFLVSLFMVSCFLYFSHYYNDTIMAMNYILVGVFAYTQGVLVLSYLLRNSKFTGGFPLFFIGNVLIITFILHRTRKKINLTNLVLSPNQIRTEQEFLQHLNIIEKLAEDSENKKRAYEIFLFSYIEKYEESCIEKNCFLKQYNESKNKNIVFLYKHIEQLYTIGTNKFPLCIEMRFRFVGFLKKKLKKKQKAKKELEKIKNQCSPNLMERYCIYVLGQELEKSTNNLNDKDGLFFGYLNLKKVFQQKVYEAVTNYLNFWNLLLSSYRDISQDLYKLSSIGNKISSLNEEIEKMNAMMRKINARDKDIERLLLLYESEILNKPIPKEKLYLLAENHPHDTDNINTTDNLQIQVSKENKIIVINAEDKHFGTITHISLSACTVFGFNRNEIVGQNINLIIPKIFQESHDEMLKEKINEKSGELIFQDEKTQLKVEIPKNFVFGVSKSKYLVPVSIKALVFQNEEERLFFYANLDNKNISENDINSCFVLTNTNFILQNYSSNSENLLGLHSLHLNGTYDITTFIKEFNEEYLKILIERNEIKQRGRINRNQIKIKHNIIRTKFNTPTLITWKSSAGPLNNSTILSHKGIKGLNMSMTQIEENLAPNISKKNTQISGKSFIMSFERGCINGKVCGFIFKFEVIKKTVNKKVKKLSSNKHLKLSTSILPDNFENINISDTNESGVENINSEFVPEFSSQKAKNTKFVIDLKSMAYKLNKDLQKADSNQGHYREQIKAIAMKKLDSIQKAFESSEESKTHTEGTEEETESQDDCTSSDGSSEFVSSSSEKKPDNVIKTVTSNNYCNQFYKISHLDKIKFMKYDYAKKMVAEVTKDISCSMVDEILAREKLKTEEYILQSRKEVEEEPTNSSFIKLKSNGAKKRLSSLKNNLVKIKDPKPQTKEVKSDTILKEIEAVLQKKDVHSSVLWIKLFTYFMLLLALAETIYFLVYLHNSEDEIAKHILLIKYGATFSLQIIHATYHVREIILLSNENYTEIYDSNRTRYLENQTDTLYEIFQKITETQNSISKLSDVYSKKTFEMLNNNTVNSSILIMKKFEGFIELSYSTSIALLQNSLLIISQTATSEILPLNSDVFLFLTNSFNTNFDIGMKEIEAFADDLEEHIHGHLWFSFIFCIVTWVANIVSFIVFQKIYKVVLSKRKAYIEVFYEIGNNIILSSLHNCEKFINEMNSKDNNILEDEEESLVSDREFINDDSSTNSAAPTSSNMRKSARIFNVGGFNIRYLLWIIGLLLTSLAITANYVIRIYAGDTYRNLSSIIRGKNLAEVYSFLSFNVFRELVFNSNSKFNGTSVGRVSPLLLNNYYNFASQLLTQVHELLRKGNFKVEKEYYELFYGDICSLSGSFFKDFFDGGESCATFSSNSTSLGLDLTLKYYIEEVRVLYHRYLLTSELKERNGFEYNLTLMGTASEKAFWPQGELLQRLYVIAHPINLFNRKENKNIHFLYRFILQPAFQEMDSILQKGADKSTDTFLLIEDVILSLVIACFVLTYLFGWKIYENNLEESIYKTKKMLSIIPLETLIKVKNITKLLNISDKSSEKSILWK